MQKQLTTIIAIFAYFVLYAPQPLLPKFAVDYNVSISQAGALMTATLIPLALAPLLYGYLLSAISPSKLLKYSTFIMGLSCLAFANTNSYETAFAIRFIQGLLLPAILTAITTHIGTHSTSEELQKNMSLFITGTILGGLFGRILAGMFATLWLWEAFYYGLSIILMAIAIWIPIENDKQQLKQAKIKLNAIKEVIAIPGVLLIYIAVFCLFFSFVALLNYLPFIINQLLDKPSEMVLGFMYCGFVMGAIASLNAQRLIVLLRDSKRVMLMGYATFLFAISMLFFSNIILIFLLLFLFCGSMFLVHSIAAAEVNRRSPEHKNIINALYVTFYYSGGVLGSYLPGLLYESYGQSALLSSLLAVSGFGFFMLLSLKKQIYQVEND